MVFSLSLDKILFLYAERVSILDFEKAMYSCHPGVVSRLDPDTPYTPLHPVDHRRVPRVGKSKIVRGFPCPFRHLSMDGMLACQPASRLGRHPKALAVHFLFLCGFALIRARRTTQDIP